MVGIVFDDGAAPFKVPEIETCIIELADVSVIIGYSIEYDFYPLIFIRIRSLNNRRMPGYFSDGGFERTSVADDPVISFLWFMTTPLRRVYTTSCSNRPLNVNRSRSIHFPHTT